MNASRTKMPAGAWIIAILFAGLLALKCSRTSFKQAAEEQVQEFLQREYGNAVEDYRADRARFRARVQQQVLRGEITQQDADQFVQMIDRMSGKLP